MGGPKFLKLPVDTCLCTQTFKVPADTVKFFLFVVTTHTHVLASYQHSWKEELEGAADIHESRPCNTDYIRGPTRMKGVKTLFILLNFRSTTILEY